MFGLRRSFATLSIAWSVHISECIIITKAAYLQILIFYTFEPRSPDQRHSNLSDV
jgi:hypothetical protein